MLTVLKRASCMLQKPKYYRALDYEMWVVYDTKKKETVFGPDVHRACMLYIEKHGGR
jgi:hypothetical protein